MECLRQLFEIICSSEVGIERGDIFRPKAMVRFTGLGGSIDVRDNGRDPYLGEESVWHPRRLCAACSSIRGVRSCSGIKSSQTSSGYLLPTFSASSEL
jgi:hypothetical protein